MKLYMKQKVFSWKDRFLVKDSSESDRYTVEGEFWTFGKKLHVFDMDQQEVAFIYEKIWTWLPRFVVVINGREVCQIVKRFTLLKPKYELEGIPWRVEGDFWQHEYTLTDDTREIMHLSKQWFSWGDSYELDIKDDADTLLCLSVALAIDAVMAKAAAAASAAT